MGLNPNRQLNLHLRSDVMYLSCVPAYGRDYKSGKEVLLDWNDGKDFLIKDMFLHGYINKSDAPKGATLNIRYKKLMKICVIKIK